MSFDVGSGIAWSIRVSNYFVGNLRRLKLAAHDLVSWQRLTLPGSLGEEMVGFVHGEECRYRDWFPKGRVRFSSIPPGVLPLLATASRGLPAPGGAGPLLPRWRALPGQAVLFWECGWTLASPFALTVSLSDSLFLSSSVPLSDAN